MMRLTRNIKKVFVKFTDMFTVMLRKLFFKLKM